MKTAKMTRLYVLSVLLVAMLVVACSGDEHHRARRAAERCYEYLQKGKYEKFVGEIAYADSMSEDYRAQMTDLIRDYAAFQERKHGRLVGVEAVGDTLMDALAHVYLQISYADSTSEEIGLPMVKVDGDWKMQ